MVSSIIMSKTRLIIGIGNPDPEYQNTRHNVGFMFLDYLAKQTNDQRPTTNDKTIWEFDKKSNSLITKVKIDKASVVLAKPQTYVNKSGEAVKKLVSTYNLQPTTYNNLIIVHDDLDIPFGNTKLSFDKNSGGHKGIESIMRALKTKKFYRLRIGLAKPALAKARQQSEKKRDEFIVKLVLSRFTPTEQEILRKKFKEGHEKLFELIR